MQAQLINKNIDDKEGEYIVRYTFTSEGRRQSGYITEVTPEVIRLDGTTDGGSYSYAFSPWYKHVKIFSTRREAYLYLSLCTQWLPKTNNRNTGKMLIMKLPKELWVLQNANNKLFWPNESWVYRIQRNKAYLGNFRSAVLFNSEARAKSVGKRFACVPVKVQINQFREDIK